MFKYLICILAGALATSHAYSTEPTLANITVGQSRIVISENILITSSVLKPTHYALNGTRAQANGAFNISSFRINKQPCTINDAGYRNDCSSSNSYSNYSVRNDPYSVQNKMFYYDVSYNMYNTPVSFALSAENNRSSHGCWVRFQNSKAANQILPNSSVVSGTSFTITDISYNQALGQIILEGEAPAIESNNGRSTVESIQLGCGNVFRNNKETREEMLKIALAQIENNLYGLIQFRN